MQENNNETIRGSMDDWASTFKKIDQESGWLEDGKLKSRKRHLAGLHLICINCKDEIS